MSNTPIHGIINVTGEIGTGKTSFALEHESGGPEKIAILNFDVKKADIFQEIEKRGFYRSYASTMVDTRHADPETAMSEQVIDDINSFKDRQFDILICDSWELFSKTLVSYVMKNKNKLKKHWHGGNQFWIALEQRGHAKKVEAGLLDVLQSKSRTVFIINHLGDEYNSNNEKTGRQLPYTSETLAQKSAFRLWLRHNEGGYPVPVGLVIKNLGKRVWVKELSAYRTVNVLPERLSHLALPDLDNREYVSVWDIINHYWNNPIGFRVPEDYEEMTPFEREMIRATQSIEELEARESLPIDIRSEITELKSQGIALPMIFNRVKAKYPELTLDQVGQVIGE